MSGQNKRIAFTINGQDIPWYVVKIVDKACHKDKFETARVFYRAREKSNIITWVLKGIKAGWILKPCRDEYENGGIVKAWIDENIFKITGAQQADVSALIDGLVEKLGVV